MDHSTKTQIDLAKKLGIDVSKRSSIVAAAIIKNATYEATHPGEERRTASEHQLKTLESLNIETESKDSLIVSALIDEALQKRNISAINKIRSESWRYRR